MKGKGERQWSERERKKDVAEREREIVREREIERGSKEEGNKER